MVQNNLGTTVKTQRKDLKLSQEELSLLSGVSLRTVRSLETGHSSITLHKLEAILDVLGLELTITQRSPL